MKEGYSREKFQEAEEAGREDLTPEEKNLLTRYRQVQQDWVREGLGAALGSNPSIGVLATLLRDMIDQDRRAMRFGKGAEIQADLEEKEANTVAGQLGLAHEEAEALNQEYDHLTEEVARATEELEDFLRRVNGQDTIQ